MSNGFPPTPAELIGIILVLLFWVIEFITGFITGQPAVWAVALLGAGATALVYGARRRADDLAGRHRRP